MAERNRQCWSKPHLRLITLIGVIVPRRFRARFRQEWEAELEYREELLARWDKFNWGAKLKLLWRSLGAFWDALWLQQLRWEDEMIQDLRFGVRMLLKNPGFTMIAVLSLALGIGANTAIFSVIDALLLRPLPVRQPEQLVAFRAPARGNNAATFAYPQFQQYRDRLPVFAGIAAAGQPIDRYNIAVNGIGGGLDPGQAWAELVSGSYFSMLGVSAVIGRTLTADDDRAPGGHPVVVISYGYWQRRFGQAPDVVGRTLTLNGTTYTILGVTPAGFSGLRIGRATDLWFPITMEPQVIPEAPDHLRDPAVNWIQIVARLQPGVSVEQARAAAELAWRQAELDTRSLNAAEAQKLAQQRLELDPFARGGFSPYRDRFAQTLTMLMIVVACVLLITCVNVANLLLARAAARQREIAMRQALGASRARILRQLLTESLVLAAPGGALGLLLGVWAGAAAPRLMDAGPLFGSVHLNVALDARVIAFSAAVSLLTVLLFSLAPALGASRASLTPALKGAGSSAVRRLGRFHPGKALVIMQVALSLVLLVGAGLFVRTLRNLQARDPGFDSERLLLVWTRHGQTARGRGPALATLYATAQERISALPGVRAVSYSSINLFSGSWAGSPITAVDGNAPAPGEDEKALWNYVAPGFLETLGIPLARGRDFTAEDNTPNSPRVAIINETMARHYFGAANPLGRSFSYTSDRAPWEIVGVMKDVNLYSLRDERRKEFFIPQRQGANLSGTVWLAVRAAGDVAEMPARIQSELRKLDPNLAVFKTDTMAQELDRSVGQERVIAGLSGLFSALAVLLTLLGLYGVISHTVARRTSEIGVRLALGATSVGVARMVLKESLALMIVGLALGVLVTLAVTRLIAARLFGVGATDPLTIAAAILLMIAVATLASLLPARRAARIDPLVALRRE